MLDKLIFYMYVYKDKKKTFKSKAGTSQKKIDEYSKGRSIL